MVQRTIQVTGEAHNPLIQDELASDPPAVPNAGLTYVKDAAGVTQLFFRSDDGTVHQITPAGAGNNTLDQAYDQGGPGAGRAITVDSGPVQLDVDANQAVPTGLFLDINGIVAAGLTARGIHIDADGVTTGIGETFYGIQIEGSFMTTGGDIRGIHVALPPSDGLTFMLSLAPDASVAPTGEDFIIGYYFDPSLNGGPPALSTLGGLFKVMLSPFAPSGTGNISTYRGIADSQTGAEFLYDTIDDFTGYEMIYSYTSSTSVGAVGGTKMIDIQVSPGSGIVHTYAGIRQQVVGGSLADAEIHRFIHLSSTTIVPTAATLYGIHLDFDNVTVTAGGTVASIFIENIRYGPAIHIDQGSIAGVLGFAEIDIDIAGIVPAGLTHKGIDINTDGLTVGAGEVFYGIHLDMDGMTTGGTITAIQVERATDGTGIRLVWPSTATSTGPLTGITHFFSSIDAAGGAIIGYENIIGFTVNSANVTSFLSDISFGTATTTGNSVRHFDAETGALSAGQSISSYYIVDHSFSSPINGTITNYRGLTDFISSSRFVGTTVTDLFATFRASLDFDSAASIGAGNMCAPFILDMDIGIDVVHNLYGFYMDFDGTISAGETGRGYYLNVDGLTVGAGETFYGIQLDMDGMTLGGTVYGMLVEMPVAYAVGAEAGIRVTGDGNIVEICNDTYAGEFTGDINVIGDGTFNSLDTNAAGSIQANDPGTSPSGSRITLGSPGGDTGVIIRGGDGLGGILRRWDLLTDAISGYFFIRDNTAGNLDRFGIDSSGNIGIGTSAPHARALLQMDSTTKGFRPPRMTTGQRDAVAWTDAIQWYNTDLDWWEGWNGTEIKVIGEYGQYMELGGPKGSGLSPSELSVGSAIIGNLGNYAYMIFADAVVNDCFFSFEVPADWDGVTDFEIKIVWASDVIVGDVEWEIDYRAAAPGELMTGTDGSDAYVQTVPGVANTQIETGWNLTISAADLAVGDHVGLRIFRDAQAGNPNDTAAGFAGMAHLHIRYRRW